MSLEPISHDHHDPHDARPAIGVAADGTALYACLRCERHKRRELFACNAHGRTNDLCLDCERQVALGVPRRKFMKDRSHITVLTKVCRTCGVEKPADEFWLDGKNEDGLKRVCGDCERKRRDYKSAPSAPMYDSYTPASAIQPALDQAIAERDTLAAEVESLRATTGALQDRLQNQAPRTDLLALNALETEVRWLRETLEGLAKQTTHPTDYARWGLTHVARAIGPAAYSLFKWADKQIAHDD